MFAHVDECARVHLCMSLFYGIFVDTTSPYLCCRDELRVVQPLTVLDLGFTAAVVGECGGGGDGCGCASGRGG